MERSGFLETEHVSGSCLSFQKQLPDRHFGEILHIEIHEIFEKREVCRVWIETIKNYYAAYFRHA